MKNPCVRMSIPLAFLLAAIPFGVAFSSPLFSLGSRIGLLYSYTRLPELSGGIQPGWQAGISASLDSRDVFSPANNGGTPSPARSFAFSGSLGLDIFSLGQSAPQSDGNLYRAWQGFGLSLRGGIRSPVFRLPLAGLPASAEAEFGGGLRATKYTGTGLLSANPALIAQAGLDIVISRNVALGLALPVEFAWKSGGTALMFGLCGTFRYR